MTAFVYPNFTAGQRLTAAMLTAGQVVTVIKGSDQTVTNSATLVDATDLSFNAEANATYIVASVLCYGAAATINPSNPGIRLNWRVPAGAAMQRYPVHPAITATDTSAATVSFRRRSSTVANPPGEGTTAANFATFNEWMILRISSTAGTVSVQFAQATAHATGSILRGDSYIQYQRIA